MGDASWALSTDLTQRVPGHALIEELLRQWDQGTIRADEDGEVVIDDEARGWYLGVLGERRVALELLRLGPEWTVLHSVPIGSGASDIDHVVIGPGGVFTINTKHLRGKTITYGGLGMRADGFGHTYIRNAVYEARRARMLLSNAVGVPVPVTGILAFVDPYDIREKAPAGEGDIPIRVVRDRDVAKVFRRTPVLPPDQLERIVAAAVVPGTWHSRPTPSTPGDKITKEFLALEAALGTLERPVEVPPVPRVPRASAPYPRAPRPRPVRRRQRRRSAGRKALSELLRAAIGLLVFWVVIQAFLNALAETASR